LHSDDGLIEEEGMVENERISRMASLNPVIYKNNKKTKQNKTK
jgi:hypothetical protein